MSDTTPETTPRKVRFTRKVRRGLATIHRILSEADVESLPPVETQLAKLSSDERDDFNRAMEWMRAEAQP